MKLLIFSKMKKVQILNLAISRKEHQNSIHFMLHKMMNYLKLRGNLMMK